MRSYLQLMERILAEGDPREDRTGTGTWSLFGEQLRFRLDDGFPLLTTKKVHFKSVVHELLWFLRGDTNARSLQAEGVRIWNEWAGDDGDLGRIYGAQWRSWRRPGGGEVDQVAEVVRSLREDPAGRRHLVCAWNPGEIEEMALPPCHALFQFHVSGDRLSCQLYQRSADIFLGVPFNMASYALLTLMMAQVCGYRPGEFVHTFGDVHLYRNHREQAEEQLRREPRPLPTVRLNSRVREITDFRYADIVLENYDPHPALPAPVAV